MFYVPDEKILERYAKVLVNFALNSGEGVKKGEVVLLEVPEVAKPILFPIKKAILNSGAHVIINFIPDESDRIFFENAQDSHLKFFPDKYYKGLVEQVNHRIYILAEKNPKELENISPKKIMAKSKSHKPYRDWREEKENRGEYTWVLAFYGTEGKAREAGLSLEEYWNEIINACYLDHEDPILKWKEIFEEQERVKEKLNSLKINFLKISGEDVDLKVGIGNNRKWLGGSGRNIPSFELFISPDWRYTSGKIRFNQPLYRYGNLIKGIELEFKEGNVINSKAEENEHVLNEMIATENADKIGEFSLTDKRLSRIRKFMAETLFDENIGGEYGNMHIALGAAYKDSYPGNLSEVTKEQWEEMGYNDSSVHTDIITTSDRKVIAVLEDGSEKLIYENGMFVI